MPFNDIMNKVRKWDNMTAKWLMRHFYLTFFQIVLFIIFLFWFVNMFNVIDSNYQAAKDSAIQRIMIAQSNNITIIVFLLLLNSFWMLFMFSSMQRIRSQIREMSYHISRLRFQSNKNSPPKKNNN
ncbi:MAG: hypothetical protein H6755_05300 [Candidatus Omnitrophica bacterium]|nr:hypothetical protein [Candidatus Omnitrophota bacterium]MCB9747808.1 hypothetical protein [Candidatus Omnitrophota bacterium]